MARKGNTGIVKRILIWVIVGLGIFMASYPFLGGYLPEAVRTPMDRVFTSVKSWVAPAYHAMMDWFSPPPPPPPPPEPVIEVIKLEPVKVDTGIPTDRRYFVDTGDCLSDACVKEQARVLELMGLPAESREVDQVTRYHEIVSVEWFTREDALNRLRLLEYYNQTGFQPNWKPKGKLFQITFGQFPEEKVANELLTHLLLIEPKTGVDFEIRVKKDQYHAKLVLAGPFDGLERAKKAQIRISESGNFNRSNIIR